MAPPIAQTAPVDRFGALHYRVDTPISHMDFSKPLGPLAAHVEYSIIAQFMPQWCGLFACSRIPDGHTFLYFRVDRWTCCPGSREVQVSDAKLILSGPFTALAPIPIDRSVEVVGVCLSHWGVKTVTGVDATEVAEQILDLTTVWGIAGRELLARMANAPSAIVRLAILETFLTRRVACVQDMYDHSAYVRDAVQLIRQSRGAISVKELSHRLGFCSRQVRRIFDEHLGLSPKSYARIIRMRQLLEDAVVRPDRNWARIAYDFGFSDQSSLINECQRMLGATPRQFLATLRANGIIANGAIATPQTV